jgi:hypothetical protein
MADFLGQRFHNRTLELDGNTFRACHLINCQVRFRGVAPFVFEGNRYEGAFWIHLIDGWKAMPEGLEPLRQELARYGADLHEALYPDPAVWASPAAYAAYLEEPERHIEFWFQREGKAPGGLRLIEEEGS